LFFGGAGVTHTEFIIVLRAAEKQKNGGRPGPLSTGQPLRVLSSPFSNPVIRLGGLEKMWVRHRLVKAMHSFAIAVL
jgi:hypothetical protein